MTLGNPFVGLPVRFSNVYQEWQAEPTPSHRGRFGTAFRTGNSCADSSAYR